MSSPSTSLATLRPDLAGSFQEFDLAMDAAGFIAHRVFPTINVAAASGKFGKIPVEQLLQQRDTARAPGSGYSRGNFTFTTDSFACEEHGAEEPVDDREAAMYAEYFDAELVATQRALASVLRNAEQRVADAVFNATTWTGSSLTTAVTNEWDDFTNATPVDDVEAAVQAVYDNSGLWPNSLVINRKVFRNLRQCSQIRDRVTSSGAGSSGAIANITSQQLAEIFDLENIIVSGTTKNTATEGQSASLSPIWSGEYAMICKVASSQDIKEPCVGRTFHYTGDGSTADGTVETYRDEAVRSDVVRVRHDVDEKRLFTEAGHLLSNITT